MSKIQITTVYVRPDTSVEFSPPNANAEYFNVIKTNYQDTGKIVHLYRSFSIDQLTMNISIVFSGTDTAIEFVNDPWVRSTQNARVIYCGMHKITINTMIHKFDEQNKIISATPCKDLLTVPYVLLGAMEY